MLKIASFCTKFVHFLISKSGFSNIRHLNHTVMERKDNVLDILLKSDEDVLDDKSVVVSLKDAKAKVFEILNDLNQEKKEMKVLEEDLPEYKRITVKLRCLLELLDLMDDSESPSPLPKTGFIKLAEGLDFPKSECKANFLAMVVDKVLNTVLPSLMSKNRYILQLGANIILQGQSQRLSSKLEQCITELFNISQGTLDWEKNMLATIHEHFASKHDSIEEEDGVLDDQVKALQVKDGQAYGRVIRVEQTLVHALKSLSEKMPILLYTDPSAALDAVDVIADMARSGKFRSPQFISGEFFCSLSLFSGDNE